MTNADLLTSLKIDLGIATTAYDTRLLQCIENAKAQIVREGVNDLNENSIDDANMTIMYAAWTWRRRESGDGMPRMLRWMLNNRIMGAHAK